METNPVIKQEAIMRTINFLPNIKMENNSAFAGIPIIPVNLISNKQQQKSKHMKTSDTLTGKTDECPLPLFPKQGYSGMSIPFTIKNFIIKTINR